MEIRFLLMFRGPTAGAIPLGIFTTLEQATNHAGKVGSTHSLWVERFVVDDPGFYEHEDEFVVWKNDVVSGSG